MITISLDEQGVFEKNTEQSDGVIMIGGVIYDDKGDPEDYIFDGPLIYF